MDLFVYVIGSRPLVVSAISCSGRAAWRLRSTLTPATGAWSGLAPGGAWCGFQLLVQALIPFLDPLPLSLQALRFLPS